MPNWCSNYVTFDGEDADLLALAKAISGKNGLLDFETFLPVPAEYENPQVFNEWCRLNWGTKWNPQCDGQPDCDEELLDAYRIGFFFDTARTPPIEFFDNVAEAFPNVYIHIAYFEMGCAFAGECDWIEGENAGHCQYDYDDDMYERIGVDVFGYELESDDYEDV